MMFYTLFAFAGFLALTIIEADPGPLTDSSQGNSVSSSNNYNGYHVKQSQQQLQTPSPFLPKRNLNGNAYPNAVSSPYGTVSTRTSGTAANQCKLHINCPSKNS
jgi:hypothetical protein